MSETETELINRVLDLNYSLSVIILENTQATVENEIEAELIKSAGFISSSLIRSQNTLNFAYIIYLALKAKSYNPAEIESYVRRWFVLSILTEGTQALRSLGLIMI